MGLLFDSFWRALAYCFRPRVLALSLLPLAVMAILAWGLKYFYWDTAVASVSQWITSSGFMERIWTWLSELGSGSIAALLAPMVVLAAVVPVVVVLSLLGVAAFMTPALVTLVGKQRFPQLEAKHGASFLRSLLWSLGSAGMALLVLAVSSPLWLVPPLVLILPPLIWGWLTYRVMAFDALAEHASRQERELLLQRHKMPLLIIGLVTGYLGAAPAIVWASGVVFAAAFIVLIPVGIWLYTMVLALSSLWFAHYCLAALVQLREAHALPALQEQLPIAGRPSSGATRRSRRTKTMRSSNDKEA